MQFGKLPKKHRKGFPSPEGLFECSIALLHLEKTNNYHLNLLVSRENLPYTRVKVDILYVSPPPRDRFGGPALDFTAYIGG